MLFLIAVILFILLFLLPFLPGVIELISKEDAEPLFISMDYIRNPRYFGKSFKKLLHRATAGFAYNPGMHDIKLSKDEKMELIHSPNISANREINHILHVIGDLVSEGNVQFNKEVYATGNVAVGPGNIIRAMVGDGDVALAEGVQFLRWLDAEGDIDIGANCTLGISASSGGRLYLSKDCAFHRLFGMPITTGYNIAAMINYPEESFPSLEPFTEEFPFIRKKERFIPPGTTMKNDVIFLNDVLIGNDCIFKGTIKSYGKIILEENITIDGNIFADGDILIGKNSKIRGHIFSQMSIYISEQTVISRPDKIKSIIGKRSIRIGKDVNIYGYVATEGDGKTV